MCKNRPIIQIILIPKIRTIRGQVNLQGKVRKKGSLLIDAMNVGTLGTPHVEQHMAQSLSSNIYETAQDEEKRWSRPTPNPVDSCHFGTGIRG